VPDRLVATIDDQAIRLDWSAVPASDLAGYIVLRGEGAGDTLQPLTAAPVAETTYRDTTAVAGVAYTYAVAAVDRAGNRSEASNRQTIRRNGPRARQ
jgi:fibronectin type 3 domain-containing protein